MMWKCIFQIHINRLTGGRLNIKMPSYQYRNFHVKDKTVSPTVLSLTWESPYMGKTVFILRRDTAWGPTCHTVYCGTVCSHRPAIPFQKTGGVVCRVITIPGNGTWNPHTITIHYPHCLSAKSIAWNQYKLTIHNKNKITTKVTEVSWKLPWQQGSCGKHGAHLGPTGPRWAPCWPHEPCYLSRAIMRFPS